MNESYAAAIEIREALRELTQAVQANTAAMLLACRGAAEPDEIEKAVRLANLLEQKLA